MACRWLLSSPRVGSRFCPRDLLDHLRQADITLASDTPFVEERHRSLGVILDSSWGWLSARERTTLSALAIFVGGFTREAAEAVADADLGVLATLTERSMIQRLPDAQGGSRYQVHELVRTYALRQVADDGPVRARHFVLPSACGGSRNVLEHQVEPLWSNPVRADLANISAATMWALTRATPSEPYGWWSVSTGSGSSLSPVRSPPGVDGGRVGPAVVAVECQRHPSPRTRVPYVRPAQPPN